MGKNSTTYTNLTHLLNLDNLLQPFDPTTCVHDPWERVEKEKKKKKKKKDADTRQIELSARSSIKEKSRNAHIHFADRFNEATYP